MTDHTFRPFEGQPVTESGFEMPAAGGGLHKSLGIDGLELNGGDVVDVMIRVKCAKVRFDPIDKDEPDGDLRRVAIVGIIGAALHSTDEAREALERQARRVAEHEAAEKARKAAERGELPFPDGEDVPGELCAHDLDPAECTDCVPLPGVVDDLPAEPEFHDGNDEDDDAPARNGLHAVTG